MKHVETPSVKQRLCAIVAAGTLAATTAGAPLMAFAETVEPSAGAQTGTGSTEVTVQLPTDVGEVGGTEDPNNPDGSDPDTYGDNIAFTVPASINFVAKPNGQLVGPAASATYIENESVFAIHASSMKVDADSHWNLVGDATAGSAANSVDFKFGPADDQLSAADYTTKQEVGNKSKWQMEFAKSDASDTSDRVQLTTSGHIARVTNDINSRTQIATIHTYVTQGAAPASSGGTQPAQP